VRSALWWSAAPVTLLLHLPTEHNADAAAAVMIEAMCELPEHNRFRSQPEPQEPVGVHVAARCQGEWRLQKQTGVA
jgi:hypothetical protein